MQIIKLNATQSTNSYLKSVEAKSALEDFTVVIAKNQTLGRGQQQTVWESEGGKNLTFSVLKNKIQVPSTEAFLLSICVSVGIVNALEQLGIPDLKVKWPNDILSGNFKIGGILIENMILGSKIRASVIGIGLNVNQDIFKSAPHAASLKNVTGHAFDLDEVFYDISRSFKKKA